MFINFSLGFLFLWTFGLRGADGSLTSGSALGLNANGNVKKVTSFLQEKDAEKCFQQTECQPLGSSTCLDVTLPYRHTARGALLNGTETEIQEYLWRWRGLRSIPRCWTALQSLLCTSFLPRCDDRLKRVFLPTYEMCRIAMGPCRLIEETVGRDNVPPFLRCDNQSLFPPSCENQYKDLKFNTSAAKCRLPLVPTEDTHIWFPGIEGCAFQCLDPLYTNHERDKIHKLIAYGATVSLAAAVFTVLTFLIDWKSANQYPAVIIFYLSACLGVSNLGWLMQLVKSREEIVCRTDNTLRYGEPSTPENFSCVLVFVLIYYFSMASLVWFVNIAYAWDLSFRKRKTFREPLDSKTTYFHLSAWSIPLILSITVLAIGELDGSSLLGICSVGFNKFGWRIGLTLGPLTISVLIGGYFLLRSFFYLISIRRTSAKVVHSKRVDEIKLMILKFGLFILFVFGSLICVYICNFYEYHNHGKWQKSLRSQVICSINITSALYPHSKPTECKPEERPNLAFIYVQLVALFGTGIAVSCWVWTRATVTAWRRFLIKQLKANVNDPIRLKRSNVIAKVYHHRHQIQQGIYAPSFQSMHEDPVAMNLTSACSQDLSTDWAANVTNLVNRRGAVTDTGNASHYLHNFRPNVNHSSVSDVSQQRNSIDSFASRQRSFDSQRSIEQELVNYLVKHQRRKTRKERERRGRNKLLPYNLPLRRGSDTSTQSLVSAVAAARALANGQPVTKSTSTGDLQQPPVPLNVHHMAIPMHPSVASVASHYQPPVALPVLSPPIPLVARQRLAKPQMSSHPFTHGMSEQSFSLTNPLQEKRRPDSRMPQEGPSTSALPPNLQLHGSPNGSASMQPQLPLANGVANYGLTYMNAYGYPPPQPRVAAPYFSPMNTFFNPNMMPNGPQMTGFTPNYPFGATPVSQPGAQLNPYLLYPSSYPVNQFTNIEDLQSLIRERSEYLDLIAPVESGSEVSEFFPMQISDSEGFFTDGGGGFVSPTADPKETQRVVEERLQRVEAAAEARTVADGSELNQAQCEDNDNTKQEEEAVELKPLLKPLASKSEKKKNKKKARRNSNKSNQSGQNMRANSQQSASDGRESKEKKETLEVNTTR